MAARVANRLNLCKYLNSSFTGLNLWNWPSELIPVTSVAASSTVQTIHVRKAPSRRYYRLLEANQKKNRLRKLQGETKKEKTNFFTKRKQDLVVKLKRYNVDFWLKTPPQDDVYLKLFYKRQTFPTQKAIEMHKEANHPTMLNNLDSYLFAFIEFNLCQAKKNKYIDSFSGTVKVPHMFEYGPERKVLAFCKDPGDAVKAQENGAALSGGVPLIKKILAGEIPLNDFDRVVATVDVLEELTNIRGLLKTRFPSVGKGTLGVDIVNLVIRFSKGIDYSCTGDEYEPDYGCLEVPIGKMNMTTDHLIKNTEALLQAIECHKPKNTKPGSFITTVYLKCPDTTEKFIIDHSEFLEAYRKDTDEDGGESSDEEPLQSAEKL